MLTKRFLFRPSFFFLHYLVPSSCQKWYHDIAHSRSSMGFPRFADKKQYTHRRGGYGHGLRRDSYIIHYMLSGHLKCLKWLVGISVASALNLCHVDFAKCWSIWHIARYMVLSTSRSVASPMAMANGTSVYGYSLYCTLAAPAFRFRRAGLPYHPIPCPFSAFELRLVSRRSGSRSHHVFRFDEFWFLIRADEYNSIRKRTPMAAGRTG